MSGERSISSVVEPASVGIRLDVWLARRFTYHSREQWTKLLKDGAVLVNGRLCRPSRRLRTGDSIHFIPPDVPEPEVDANYTVVADTGDFLVIDKPGNLPCHPAGAYFENTLWRMLCRKFAQIHIVNRLDRETSGLVLAAKDSKTAAALAALFHDGGVDKYYLALVHGELNNPLRAEGFLTNDNSSPIRKKRCLIQLPASGAEHAVTNIRPLKRGDGMTLLEVKPETGRLHQIRATLCSLGYPLVGDKIYGLDDTMYLRFIEDALTAGDMEKLRLPRQALHALRLELNDPKTGTPMSFESPYPEFARMGNDRIFG